MVYHLPSLTPPAALQLNDKEEEEKHRQWRHSSRRSNLLRTFVPHVQWSSNYLAAFVGILGTTISPYLFFWQASQEVEEDRKIGRRTVHEREGATNAELRNREQTCSRACSSRTW